MGILVLTRHEGRSLLLADQECQRNRKFAIKVKAISRTGACLELVSPEGSEIIYLEHGKIRWFANGDFSIQPGHGIAKGQVRFLLDYPKCVTILRDEVPRK